MKKIVFPVLFLFLSISVYAQPTFNLGLKAGMNSSKMSYDIAEYTSESILDWHYGAFGRIGFGRFLIQPEVYFSSKGGDISSNLQEMATSFDYSTVDVPLLLGLKIIKKENVELHLLGGPVFSFLTDKKVTGDQLHDKKYFEDHYFAYQYGLGLDVFFMTIGARMEHAGGSLYQLPDLNATNKTFMVSVGFKIF